MYKHHCRKSVAGDDEIALGYHYCVAVRYIWNIISAGLSNNQRLGEDAGYYSTSSRHMAIKTSDHLPKALEDCPHLRCTIGCTKIFIECPRVLELQAITWSDYKKHNTIKCIVCITPDEVLSLLQEA